ncbi:PAS domain-containing sensor histidine kinase [Geomobilimonas luticola]|uniref:histidine kinase n=1 Tax=Geomobilimonas luticola TaxID=1114878 RepID=A0ABS5SEV8_9BACT|nr:PAS domain-containing sensor histidine kinase [Geomobilimonas luticola]MBT0653899.1 HAMP domain-containing protein [Geomobilimonas luticola]
MKRLTLFKKILLAMLLISLLPLLVSSLLLSVNLGNTREKLAARIAATADQEASESLRLKAEQVADNITDFLATCEGDLKLLAALPRDPRTLKAFYDSRRGEVWHRLMTPTGPGEIREWFPRYASLSIVDRSGQETFAIQEGRILPRGELRDVSLPANTEFKSEEYFLKTRSLKPGEIYVSRLTGFHVSKQEQLSGALDPESAVHGKEYRGVIRFATPMTDSRGKFAGIVVLSLDHRHLMEFSQHILPGKNATTVFPSYQSGNYAFLFDDEGWIITHPKFWDIRGLDRDGKLIPPYTAASSKEDVATGRIPYNLDHAGFVHPNYPVVANLVREKKSGHVDITNVGGATKVMAFAPILYRTGEYERSGIFGGVTIGFQTDQFREAARTSVTLINRQLQEHITTSAFIVALTSLLVVFCAWLLSRGITRPLAVLTDRARQLAAGETGNRVDVASSDEVGELAESFNRMAGELEQRKNNLLRTLGELRTERNFKESVLDSISSAILTLSPDGTLTSINGTGRRFLGTAGEIGAHHRDVFRQWGDMPNRIERVLGGEKAYGREPLTMDQDGRTHYFEIGFFPIYEHATGGITVTMRDETEKEELREEMTRMDRLASLGKLSAGIAHEVRNPLTGISLLLDDLHDRTGLDADSKSLMGKALAEIERVERLIAALLNFASPPKARFVEGDLNQVLQDTFLLLKRECERQKVELSFLPARLPSFPFDGEKIKQSLLNIVKNALEAMPDGGQIGVRTGLQEGMAVITVADSGPGIPEADLPLIFEPFFTRKGAGTGLGLSITQRIVEEHHGRISVESTAGKGTRFTILLPLEPVV